MEPYLRSKAWIYKLDKASVLGNAIKYIKELQESRTCKET
ncbi:hypothetical protein CsSME_00003507 [Camellia sinensis var. sinensis]